MSNKSKILVFILCLSGLYSCSRDEKAGNEPPDFSGMWSDPPLSAVNFYCALGCTDAAIEHLNALLEDPELNDQPVQFLFEQVAYRQNNEFIPSHLTERALENYPLDEADDPGYWECDPWGLARQMFAIHQLEITQQATRIDFHYGEWEGQRTIYLDGRSPADDQPLSKMGFSVGHFEGDALVVETSHVQPNWMLGAIKLGSFIHSDKFKVVERYWRSDGGKTLNLEATFTDPEMLTVPYIVNKQWSWAPDEEIYEYKCIAPSKNPVEAE